MAAEWGLLFSSGWMCLIPRIRGSPPASIVSGTRRKDISKQPSVAARVQTRARLGRYTWIMHACWQPAVRGDRGRAIELVHQADAIFHELGMEPFAQQAVQVAEAIKARMHAPARLRAPSPAQSWACGRWKFYARWCRAVLTRRSLPP